jgi:hypothetical protein
MILTAHQPLYLPWLGLIHKVALSDKFCLLDDVQFADRDFIHRNRVLSANGSPKWLSIPVEKKNHRTLKIKDIQVLGNDWVESHLQIIRNAYCNHKYFPEYFPEISSTMKNVNSKYLIDYTIPLLNYLFIKFGCKPEITFSSDFAIEKKKSELIQELSVLHSATTYLSGVQGKNYLDIASFEAEGVKVAFQEFHTKPYPQESSTFQAGLSAIDLLFNSGPECRANLFSGNIKSL